MEERHCECKKHNNTDYGTEMMFSKTHTIPEVLGYLTLINIAYCADVTHIMK